MHFSRSLLRAHSRSAGFEELPWITSYGDGDGDVLRSIPQIGLMLAPCQ